MRESTVTIRERTTIITQDSSVSTVSVVSLCDVSILATPDT